MSDVIGQALQVVDVVGSHSYALREEALDVLLDDPVCHLPVVVVSVAGAFRGGKSFLLNYLLRYLNANDLERQSDAWLGKDDEPLVGFSWRPGAKRNTTGIQIWSRPFPMTLPSGEKVAVVLMDTEGTFNSENTMADCINISALSSLLSSMQVYNVCKILKKDDIRHLQGRALVWDATCVDTLNPSHLRETAVKAGAAAESAEIAKRRKYESLLITEYTRIVMNDAEYRLQHLTFLIRDWMYQLEHRFGAEDGKRVLERALRVETDPSAQQQGISWYMRSYFEDINCFLMAHPGFAAVNYFFEGRLSDLQAEFRTCLLEFIPLLLAPNKLVTKCIRGRPLTAREFVQHIRDCVDVFNRNEMPTLDTILQTTTQAGLKQATKAARARFASGIVKCTGDRVLPTATMCRLHAEAVAAARLEFTPIRIIGNRQNVDQALEQITQEFDDRLRNLTALNEAKLSKAYDSAMAFYLDKILEDTSRGILHNNLQALEPEHHAAAAIAARLFKINLHTSSKDEDTTQFLESTTNHLKQLLDTAKLNVLALRAGCIQYRAIMKKKIAELPALVLPLPVPFRLLQMLVALNEYHEEAKNSAIVIFKSHRRNEDVDNVDRFYDRLIVDISWLHEYYEKKSVKDYTRT